MNLGAALSTLGVREWGTQRLEEAVAAYRAALEDAPCSTKTTSAVISMMRSKRLMERSKNFARRTRLITSTKPGQRAEILALKGKP